ncbi:MAG TPA: IreB family regulatory phosphoprotein [Tissierellaceae bacterium]|mgnify:CR=1 FL=1|nr:IreB family regulatory phosphoprotein [Tissierellaceae bacterium]
MSNEFNETMMFNPQNDNDLDTKDILFQVYEALKDKGYDPINQIIGYILSGDPTYITSHNNARNLIRQIERDELLGEILKEYLSIEK